MDEYSLINSKDISKHCREINHKFNTEELAVLIYRNKRLSIDEKIKLYEELIRDYPDMEVIERINCNHYDSVKDMIKGEIERINMLRKRLQEDETDMFYTYNPYYQISNCTHLREGFNEINKCYKTFSQVFKAINEDLQDDDDEIKIVRMTKRTLNPEENFRIEVEYVIDENKNLKMININNSKDGFLDIDSICLNIPTPFKKGDLLTNGSRGPSLGGCALSYEKFPFVLVNLCNWYEDFQKALLEGNYDSSDMEGICYMISEEDALFSDNIFDYDSWEYFDGKLEGSERILRGVGNLLKDEISLDCFIKVYEKIKNECNNDKIYLYFTDEGLKLAGLNDEDIEKLHPVTKDVD